jgi:hypothetical protein
MEPVRATIEEFAAAGCTHITGSCPRCGVIRLHPMSSLPKMSRGLTLADLSELLRCSDCRGPLSSVKLLGRGVGDGRQARSIR